MMLWKYSPLNDGYILEPWHFTLMMESTLNMIYGRVE